jgi:hypothetical protein
MLSRRATSEIWLKERSSRRRRPISRTTAAHRTTTHCAQTQVTGFGLFLIRCSEVWVGKECMLHEVARSNIDASLMYCGSACDWLNTAGDSDLAGWPHCIVLILAI